MMEARGLEASSFHESLRVQLRMRTQYSRNLPNALQSPIGSLTQAPFSQHMGWLKNMLEGPVVGGARGNTTATTNLNHKIVLKSQAT